MPIAVRDADVVWEGPLAKGAGVLASTSGALDELGFTWASRTESPDGKTSPEELIAAAHASCFALALSLVLGEGKTPPARLEVHASCTLDEVEGAPRITSSQLEVRAQVPGLEAPDFDAALQRAAGLCPVSNALLGNVDLEVQGQLVQG
jgi:lipoyl-dependent peroxiredoxin